ncbi:MAG: ATP-dependent DNA helicase [Pseudomonadota bacterium]
MLEPTPPSPAQSTSAGQHRPPSAPALAVGVAGAVWVSDVGEVFHLNPLAAAQRASQAPPLLCHARAVAGRLGMDRLPAFDLLELYAFVRPAHACVPTIGGVATALGRPRPADLESSAISLLGLAHQLLRELSVAGEDRSALDIAWTLAQAGWVWGPSVLSALGYGDGGKPMPRGGRGFNVWDGLPDWREGPPPPPPSQFGVDPDQARQRLAALLGDDAEHRPQQSDYATAASGAFQPRSQVGAPHMVLAEAGTGVGKTLGYISPASLWAERNKGPVWISTYTRNLQHQIDGELDRLFPQPQEKAERVVIRKGRENYLCLLNLQEAVRGLAATPQNAVALGLMARWASRTRDGDMVGGDFPGWLVGLLGPARTIALTDRRGECIYSACQHYGKCYIERSQRQARQAQIVVANHALVMVQAAMGSLEEGQFPTHLVFDEGHHVFDAADSAFAAHLTGQETQDLRRWILGAESTRRSASRLRGLQRRLEDLIAGDEEAIKALDAATRAAACLPGEGWRQRVSEGRPSGGCERFLSLLRTQLLARSRNPEGPFSLECETQPLISDLPAVAEGLHRDLAQLKEPLVALRRSLMGRLDEEGDQLDSDARRRIEGLCRGLDRRAIFQLSAWQNMLETLEQETPPEFTDWFGLERLLGRDQDVGMYRHWVDPTAPFAEAVLSEAHGVLVTSATLTDGSGDVLADWEAAEARTGASRLPNPAIRAQLSSPYDYGGQTKILVVRDLSKANMDLVAGAYRDLFTAAGGGALGLFTAIARLKAVHQRIALPLEEAGLPLFAQHVDALDTSTLVDIFRAEEDSCLLGTDAVRDGVDVPGRSLRLIVFDRVPWPRPDIRHKARRALFGGAAYDDRLTRLKLRQAYGRLLRRSDDRGVFVMLDSRLPSRLAGAFPDGTSVERVGLAEAIATTKSFLSEEA